MKLIHKKNWVMLWQWISSMANM